MAGVSSQVLAFPLLKISNMKKDICLKIGRIADEAIDLFSFMGSK
jgi:hypothetical protein